ncbi:MAG: hypothetical protein ACK5TK_08535 [Betaproteobacteria bacterium]
MGLFDRLFERRRGRPEADEDDIVKLAAERAAEIVDPRLKLLPRYVERLRPALETTIEHIRATVTGLGAPREASAAAWSTDPTIRALFARADDVAAVVSRAREVQKFFRQNAAASEVFAALGMAFEERTVLAPALVDGVLRQDVARTQLSFGDRRVAVVGATELEFRRAIGHLIYNQYLLNTAQRLAGQDRQRKDLTVTRSLLRAKLRMLQGRETTLADEMADGESADPVAAIADLERQLERTDDAFEGLGGGVDALEKEFEILIQTLSHPGQSVEIAERRLRIDHYNTVQTDGGGDEIEFSVLRIATDPPRTRAAVLIRFARTDLRAGGLNFGAAERAL